MTCPSFLAASTNAGVTASGGGAAAMTRVENTAPVSNAPEPLSTVRRDKFGFFIGSLVPLFGRDLVHRTLSFIPNWHTSLFVDSALPLPLDLSTNLVTNQYRTRPEFGRVK